VVASPKAHPRAGVDYPGTWATLRQWFPDDAACLVYLERLRWPEGFACPHCSSTRGWRIADGRWSCGGCARKVSVTAGTILHATRTPLTTWFAAVWYVTNQKLGVSALGLQRALGLGRYETTWTMLHKLRRAMVRPDRDLLAGDVEVDESYVGGVETGAAGRLTLKKAIVAIAVEVKQPRGFGRARLRRVRDCSAASLVPFVCDVVAPGSVVLTDGWRGYNPLPRQGYTRKATVISAAGDPAHVSMPAVHRVASLLKRWLLGTHQGAVQPGHLDYYLDEFTFRFNRRTSRRRGLLFYRLLEQAVATDPIPYDAIVGGKPEHNM
jgi:hypothetical protein